MSVRVGSDRLAATDDPIFLGLRGPSGREFRLAPGKGRAWRRGADEVFVLAAPGEADTNVANPELNDPAAWPLDPKGVSGVYLRKGLEPIPNVRGRGEMDDRLQVDEIRVEIRGDDGSTLHFARTGGFWLGLVCGLEVELPVVESA